MASLRRFLILDNNSTGRFVTSKTLLRHYPLAVVQECHDLNTATAVLGSLPAEGHGTVVIARSTNQMAGRDLMSALRTAHATIPIVWMAERDQAQLAQSVGATRFLDRDAWLLIGTAVEDLG